MGIIKIEQKYQKEGASNKKLELKKLLTYVHSVYQIFKKINQLKDIRKRITIPLSNKVNSLLMCFILQYSSIYEIYTSKSVGKRIQHFTKGRILNMDSIKKY